MLPKNVSEELSSFGTKLGSITVGFIYGAMGIILIALIWLLVAFKFITWKGALILTIIIIFFLYGSILLYKTTMEHTITNEIDKLNKTFDKSMPTIIQNVMNTLNDKEEKKDILVLEDSIES